MADKQTILPEGVAETRLRGAMSGRKDQGLIARLFSRGVKSLISERRVRCCVVAVLVLVDKSLPLDGLVTEVGTETALFRPASSYTLDRQGAEVVLRFADHELRARILRSTTDGYELQLQQALGDEQIAGIAAEFGGSAPPAA